MIAHHVRKRYLRTASAGPNPHTPAHPPTACAGASAARRPDATTSGGGEGDRRPNEFLSANRRHRFEQHETNERCPEGTTAHVAMEYSSASTRSPTAPTRLETRGARRRRARMVHRTPAPRDDATRHRRRWRRRRRRGTHRSPVGPPLRPASPSPRTRSLLPSSTPHGTVTLTDLVFCTTPLPEHEPQYSSTCRRDDTDRARRGSARRRVWSGRAPRARALFAVAATITLRLRDRRRAPCLSRRVVRIVPACCASGARSYRPARRCRGRWGRSSASGSCRAAYA